MATPASAPASRTASHLLPLLAFLTHKPLISSISLLPCTDTHVHKPCSSLSSSNEPCTACHHRADRLGAQRLGAASQDAVASEQLETVSVEQVDASGLSMRDAERGLLVHGDNMTPTLARFYGSEITLQVLERAVLPAESEDEYAVSVEGVGGASPCVDAARELFVVRAGEAAHVRLSLLSEAMPLVVKDSELQPELEEEDGQTYGKGVLRRFVRLHAHSTDEQRCVEFGAIDIFLCNMPLKTAQRVLLGKTPLGTILREDAVAQVCKPQCFFSITLPDDEHTRLMGSAKRHDEPLFGRANVIYRPDGAVLARVVEVLPYATRI